MIVDVDATTINNFVLPSSDLRIDVFRSGGAGGQSVNTTESGVRVTHLPTGLSVVCQDERSQHNNKAAGVKYLKSKLLQREKEKRMRKKEEEHIEREDNSFGSQVYNSDQQPEGALAVNHSNIPLLCHHPDSLLHSPSLHNGQGSRVVSQGNSCSQSLGGRFGTLP